MVGAAPHRWPWSTAAGAPSTSGHPQYIRVARRPAAHLGDAAGRLGPGAVGRTAGRSTRRRRVAALRTLPAGWAYGAVHNSSAERVVALSGWLDSITHAGHTAPSATERPCSAAKLSSGGRFFT
jgi:hypothetical protein